MKSVGKQLQEARLAKNWTPELAARETKIKVDRLKDLESDDYSHFTSPTYARGFVRTYARALSLDEYKILRQLDNKLPDDDSANIVTDTGVAYLPETTLPQRAAHQDLTGLYIVMGLGAVVTLAIAFVLFEAYRVGELSRWFGSKTEAVAVGGTNSETPGGDATPARAMPADGSTPPPAVSEPATNAVTDATPPPATTNAAPVAPLRALPVDPAATGEPATTTAPATDAPVKAMRALPVDAQPSDSAQNTTPSAGAPKAPPRAMPVSAADLAATPRDVPVATPAGGTQIALNTTPPVDTPPSVPPTAAPSLSSKFPNATRAVNAPPPPPVALPVGNVDSSNPPVAKIAGPDSDKPLILTASQDSFVRVTNLDSTDADKPVYAAVLRTGQSISFTGHKFSINVGVPYAVAIRLDGVNYGPHSDGTAPETFTVQSHVQ